MTEAVTDPAVESGSEGKAQEGDDLESRIRSEVERQTTSLKANRDEILKEKRELKQRVDEFQSQLEKLGGTEGVERLLEMKNRLEKDELGRLLADGKHDEWFDQRTEALRADYENKISALTKKATEADDRARGAEGRYNTSLIRNDVTSACISASVVETAIEDVLLNALSMFEYDSDRGTPVIRDQAGGILPGKDGVSPKTVAEWLEEQKQVRRHWWPPSNGAGLEGGGAEGVPAEDLESAGRMSMPEYRKFREKKGMSSGYAAHNF